MLGRSGDPYDGVIFQANPACGRATEDYNCVEHQHLDMCRNEHLKRLQPTRPTDVVSG